MLRSVIFTVVALFAPTLTFSTTFVEKEPQIPAGASWGITIEQVRRLTGLDLPLADRSHDSYVIQSATQYEFVAVWQDLPISFYVAKDIGLYAINIEMIPNSIRHTEAITDQEMIDIEHCAPIRFAILQKYGIPSSIAPNWEGEEFLPFPSPDKTTRKQLQQTAVQWPYARNWLIWEGTATRLALGDQSIWYMSQVGMKKKLQRKKTLIREQEQAIDNELTRRLNRQHEIEAARATVPERASAFISSF